MSQERLFTEGGNSALKLQKGAFSFMRNVVCIPAFEPDERLLKLIDSLEEAGLISIVITDDGSGSRYTPVFIRAEEKGCVIVRHEHNLGKGAAIKTAIEKAVYQFGKEIRVITADADGKYLPRDIIRISDTLESYPDHLVLGVRDFGKDSVPLRSNIGNKITSAFFKSYTGVYCSDTQTGLRGIPSSLIPLALSVSGDRYDYELNFLIEAVGKAPLIMIPIETVRDSTGAGSRFRPLADSLLMYKKPLGKAGLGLAAFGILVVAADHIIRNSNKPE